MDTTLPSDPTPKETENLTVLAALGPVSASKTTTPKVVKKAGADRAGASETKSPLGTTQPLPQPLSHEQSLSDTDANQSRLGILSDMQSPAFIAFLVSTISHLALILTLALIIFGADQVGNRGLAINGSLLTDDGSATQSFEINEVQSNDLEKSENVELPSSSQIAMSSRDLTTPSLFEPPSQMESPIQKTNLLAQIKGSDVSGTGTATTGVFRSTGIESRNGNRRQEAVAKRGGTRGSEDAVENALLWLTAHQSPDGGWSLHFDEPPCNGQCGNASEHLDPERAAATGLALLCYLGAGYTHHTGPYQQQVNAGLYFLMQTMKRNQHGGRFPELTAKFAMYEQGIATLALCEAYQMTQDPQLKETCQLGVQYIFYAQHTDGGWGYDPRLPGDISIGCWQIMALKSALGAGLQVPIDSIKVFDKFLDGCQAEGGSKYRYRQLGPEPGPTAMGLLMRMYRGWPQTEPKLLRGMEYLLKQGPSPDDVYYNYYATQVFFQQESAMWDRWNPLMRDMLVATQARQGHEKGSWYFPDNRHNEIGGRLYTTTMCCMTLEVYYRHMPIYSHIKVEDFEL